MSRLITSLVILLAFILPVPALAQTPADGVIDGRVINSTSGGGSVAGIEITLITYVRNVMAETRTTITDEEGNFQFDNVATENTYLVSARYMAVDYYLPVTFDPETTHKYIEVLVCDTTTSDEAIRVGLAHTIINVEEESIQVTEVFWLLNDGDKTYTGADGVLVFTLPEGAQEFQAPQELMPDYQFLDDNRVAYLVPFPPGERQLVYSYRLAKPGSDEFIIPLEVDYPTDGFELMIAGEGIEVAVTRLAPATPIVTATGERFIHFRGENLLRGTVLDLHLSNLSGGGWLSSAVPWVIIAVVIAGIAVYMMQRRRKRNKNG